MTKERLMQWAEGLIAAALICMILTVWMPRMVYPALVAALLSVLALIRGYNR